MNGDKKIAEVRGVNKGQELEPQFADIVDSKMNEFGGDEAKEYKNKSHDMKLLTELTNRQLEAENNKTQAIFTKEELRFIYELDGKIKGFGYNTDPRIESIQKFSMSSINILIEYSDCPQWILDTIRLNEIELKQKEAEKNNSLTVLTKEELRFIYELDKKIVGFRNEEDRRLNRMKDTFLRSTRPLLEDSDCFDWVFDNLKVCDLYERQEKTEKNNALPIFTKEELRFIYELDKKVNIFVIQTSSKLNHLQWSLLSSIEILKEYPDCPSWVNDRLKLITLHEKQLEVENNKTQAIFTKEELRFIYELDGNIEYSDFLHDLLTTLRRDRKKRNKLEDYIFIFGIVDQKEIEDLEKKLNLNLGYVSLNNLKINLEVNNLVLAQTFTERRPTETTAGIRYSDDFKQNISPFILETTASEHLTFSTYVLDEDEYGYESKDVTAEYIISYLELTEEKLWTYSQLSQLVQNQSPIQGKKTKTPVLNFPIHTDGSRNLFPIKQVDGSVALVSLAWDDDYSHWYLSYLDYSDECDYGSQVLIRN